ncbi:uncharacterized protein LOC126576390 [Anopheles aquasalis]|uniref:uncharacterized protein LOC126576390 n=1 Tax=Anopheles aquasalis TaxID=42839 RepID=UPI00215AB927|nr:uncharacterized protein LOC126576390 [Anopheles aquasalis]XP_050093603.1 uncharacterized protein LOC126576390 [Anopheles aquasalis]XP_050093604.1 uncharacterized protein LOC126576390 [Anopheles aquasalis]
MDAERFEPRTIVNGALLKKHIDEQISIHLKIDRCDDGSRSLTGKSTDGLTVQVFFPDPLMGLTAGWMEVIGIAAPNNIVRGKELVTYFDCQEKIEEFDVSGHNMLCTLLSVCKDPFTTGSSI